MVGPSPADEEVLKKNTDCVYFLASPLTCKKGSECEYRHSEIARVNPRDCWFWLHGNCLNPKCGFRHPPLDGLLGTQAPTSTGHSLPSSQTMTTPATAYVPNASGKPGVPCIFFQKGLCLKGDWCPFLHNPNSASNKASLVPGTASAADNTTLRKALGGPEKFVQEKMVPPIDIDHSVKVYSKPKPAVEVKPVPLPPRNEFSISRMPHTSGGIELPGYTSVPPVTDGNPVRWSIRAQQHHLLDEPGSMYNKDAEEVSREPSPGFDVLVDDERRDSDYYPSEDQYGMPGEHETRNEYDIDHATDYNMIAEIESERFQDPHGYDSHELLKGRHALEQHRASSERMSGGSYLERRQYAMADNQHKVDELDLRHRLAKRKKANGLRSVISHEHVRDRHVEDQRFQGLHRDDENVSLHENSLSSRFRGRIKLPGKSSPPSERDIIQGADRGKLSPVRVNAPSLQGRIRDRIKERVEESFHNGGKNHRGLHLRRDMIGDNAADFTGPKSLAELKNWKNIESIGQQMADQQSLGKRKHLMLDGSQQSGSDLSFEGPKPLEEILKRKRREKIGSVSGQKTTDSEHIIEDNNKIKGNDATENSLTILDFVSSQLNNETITPVGNTKDVGKSSSVDKTEAEESRSAAGNSTALRRVASTVEAEDGTAVEDGDGESDYEQMGGEDFDLYDGENGDADGEYLEDEDDDDFAKKMGVMYS